VLEDTPDDQDVIARIAALDVGKAELVCCVRIPSPQRESGRAQEVQTYSTMTRSLLGLADRLHQRPRSCGHPVPLRNCPDQGGSREHSQQRPGSTFPQF
jgi:hypothetical protein